MLEIPEIVRQKARVEGVEDWIDVVPEWVEDLARRWDLETGAVIEGGTESLVVETRTRGGHETVLKMVVPRGDCAAREARALRLADGDGAAALLDADELRHALLIERLGTSMHTQGLPMERRHEILAATAQSFWRPVDPDGLWSGAAKGEWLIDHIERRWQALGRPCDRRTVDHAIRCAERRITAHTDDRAVLVHGDVHQWNALRRGDGWALVDPDGLHAEPAYDLGIIMREDPEAMLTGDPRARSRRLAVLTGIDETAIWEWGVVERLSTALLARTIGLEPLGTSMLAAAVRIAGS